ncbi:hypothetical protein Sango_2906700 [Sesamum angolense]|uniref:Retrotransposon gag domain-containing protein n=1 Tax=Sesamum angolense TaxID=2727404 RepID=A0AAE1T5R3_9LAMI|nr:hypothetical protein Sango_2906700 [Sesamum angolense]
MITTAIREQLATLAPVHVAIPSDVSVPEEVARSVGVFPERSSRCPVPSHARTLRGATGNRKHRKTELSFFAKRQKEGETLKQYLQRFNTVTLEVLSATQEAKASVFAQGLLDGDFFKSLSKKPTTKYDTFLARAAKYINMEDAQTSKRERCGKKQKETKEDDPSKNPGRTSGTRNHLGKR